MSDYIKSLVDMYDLDVVSPFELTVNGEKHRFQCLIRGYGARSGMIVDKTWTKIEIVESELTKLGYGYSCFDIEAGEDPSSFVELLKDWGKQGT